MNVPNLPGTPLVASDYERLARCFVPRDVADAAHLRRVTDAEGRELIGADGRRGNFAGIVYPYFLPKTGYVCDYRLRRDCPDLEDRDGRTVEKNKYMSAPGSGNRLYFFPGTRPDWLADPTIPIVIVEGPKKALALWVIAWHGIGEAADRPRFLPIGLSGVWNWRGRTGKAPGPEGDRRDVYGIIADLRSLELQGREISILFDTNVCTNHNVWLARRQCACWLAEQGGRVRLADLPPEEGVNGPDDAAANHGAEYILDVLEVAANFEHGEVSEAGVNGTGSPNTDLANGRRLVGRHQKGIRHCKKLGWLYYDGSRWARDEKGDGEIMLRAKETALSVYEEARNEKDDHRRKILANWAIQSESATRLRNMVELAKSEPSISVTIEQLDADPWLFNCQNGTLDLRDGQLREHRPEDLITKISPVVFDPLAKCPLLDAFLERIFVEKPRLIAYIRRVAGYCLTGLTHEQVLFFLYGLGANGKSTLIEILRNALGEYGRNINPKTLLDMNDSEAKFDLADICGARFVVAAEPEGGRRLAEALVKQVTGNDHIKARNMYKGYFEYVPQFKIFIVSNHRFTVDGGSEAIVRRLRMLPFEERIPENERDRLLLDKLCAELSGILNWAIAGCLEWQRGGLGMPDEVMAATLEFMAENDEVRQWIDTCCVVLEALSEEAGVLYKDFLRFSAANGNEQPMKARAFGRKLHDKGFKRDIRGRGNYVRLGIALRTERE